MSFQSRERLTIAQDLFVTPAVAAQAPRPSLRRRIEVTLAAWRERAAARRCLARMDARSLRDAGISPAAAAFEAGRPFWQKLGGLR